MTSIVPKAEMLPESFSDNNPMAVTLKGKITQVEVEWDVVAKGNSTELQKEIKIFFLKIILRVAQKSEGFEMQANLL